MVMSSHSQLNLITEVLSISFSIETPCKGLRLLQTRDEDLLELAKQCERWVS